MLIPTAQRRLLPHLLHHLAIWREFLLVALDNVGDANTQPLDAAVQAYLRSCAPRALFDHPVVIWWSDADHALLIPCTLHGDQHSLAEDSQLFRLVRTRPPAHPTEQAASSL